MKLNFSVVLIARNESKTLPRLVKSLEEYQARGGEIILVDTGSTDDTPRIARELGCTVYEEGTRFMRTISKSEAEEINRMIDHREEKIVSPTDRLFDFSAARNYAASLAPTDMVAMPDCDEIYTKLDLNEVCNVIESDTHQLEYNFVFAHDEHGKEIVKFLHSKFYDRTKMSWVGIIHEVLEHNRDTRVNVCRLGEEVIKLEHFQNPETNRGGYLKGLALAVIDNPENDRNAHYFGRELLYAGRPRSAILQLRRHVAMGKWPEERSQSLVHIGEAHAALGEMAEAIHAWMDAFDACPTRREPLMKIAEFYYRAAKSPEHVIPFAEAALTIPPNNFYASFQPFYEHYPHEMLYWAYQKKGDLDTAAAHFKKCLEFQPHSTQYLHDYRLFNELPQISIIIPTLRPAGLERVLASIENLTYPKELIDTIILHDAPRIGVPKRVKEGVARSTGEWIVYAADDMEFEPNCIMEGLMAHMAGGDMYAPALIAFNSGPVSADEGNICEHFMINRVFLEIPELNGEIFDTDFHHVGVDNLLWARMKKAGEAMWCEHAKITHHHFSRGAEMDEVHKLAWDPEHVAADRALLATKLAQL